jgi:hypothetical protein
MFNKEKQCRPVGRECKAHPACSAIPSLNFERLSTSQAKLENEKKIKKRIPAIYLPF